MLKKKAELLAVAGFVLAFAFMVDVGSATPFNNSFDKEAGYNYQTNISATLNNALAIFSVDTSPAGFDGCCYAQLHNITTSTLPLGFPYMVESGWGTNETFILAKVNQTVGTTLRPFFYLDYQNNTPVENQTRPNSLFSAFNNDTIYADMENSLTNWANQTHDLNFGGGGGRVNGTGVHGFGFDSNNGNAFMVHPTPSVFDVEHDFTYMMWVKVDSLVNNGAYFDTSTGGGQVSLYSGTDCSYTTTQVAILINNCGNSVATPTGTVITGAWMHVAVVHTGSTAKIYINGSLRASGTAVGLAGTVTRAEIGRGAGTNARIINGQIDDVYTTGRALSEDEIRSLMGSPELNVSLGSSPETAPNITINAPTNSTYSSSSVGENFLATSTQNTTFSLKSFIDGVLSYNNPNYSNGTVITNTSSGLSDGAHNFTVVADDGVVSGMTKLTVIFTVDTKSPMLQIQMPTMNQSFAFFSGNAKNIQFNYTSSDLTSPVSQCWYNINGTNYTIGGCANITLTILKIGSYNLTLFSNDSVNNVNETWVNFSVDFTNKFNANDSVSGSPISSFSLFFQNATNSYNASTSTGTIFVNTSNIPFGSSVLFQWSAFGYNDSIQYYAFNNSAVQNFTNLMTPAGLSITVFDELTFLPLVFTVSATNTTCSWGATSVLSYTNTTGNLCLNENRVALLNSSYNDTTVNPSGTIFTYPQRDYYLTLSNSSNLNLIGYLLRSDKGIFYAFVITDYNNNPIDNALITVSKLINNTYVPIEQEKSDSTGTANFFLDFNNLYQVKVESNNFVSLIFYLQPSTINRVAYVKLKATGSSGATLINLTTALTSISYSITPKNPYQNGSFTVSYFISDSANELTNFGFRMVYRNLTYSTEIFNQNNTSPSGATITFTTPNNTGWYDVYAFFDKSGFPEYTIPVMSYYITGCTGFGCVNAGGFGLQDTTLQLIAIIITTIATGFGMRYFGLFGGMIIGLGVLALFTFGLGFIPLYWFIATALITIALIVLRNIF